MTDHSDNAGRVNSLLTQLAQHHRAAEGALCQVAAAAEAWAKGKGNAKLAAAHKARLKRESIGKDLQAATLVLRQFCNEFAIGDPRFNRFGVTERDGTVTDLGERHKALSAEVASLRTALAEALEVEQVSVAKVAAVAMQAHNAWRSTPVVAAESPFDSALALEVHFQHDRPDLSTVAVGKLDLARPWPLPEQPRPVTPELDDDTKRELARAR